MTRIVHVEMTSPDVNDTARFYEDVLGLTSRPSPFVEDYTLLDGPDGPLGAVMSRTFQQQPVIVWFAVDDIDAALARTEAAGGSRRGAVNAIPGQGRVAYAQAPDGTVFGLRQTTGRPA